MEDQEYGLQPVPWKYCYEHACNDLKYKCCRFVVFALMGCFHWWLYQAQCARFTMRVPKGALMGGERSRTLDAETSYLTCWIYAEVDDWSLCNDSLSSLEIDAPTSLCTAARTAWKRRQRNGQ